MNGITSRKIGSMDVGNFWKHNEPILERLERQIMPPSSRLVYKDVTTGEGKDGTVHAQYDLVNFYDNRKNLLKIIVEFGKDHSIKKEEILAMTGRAGAKKTTLGGGSITSAGHIAWLRNMTERRMAGDALR
ncbi:MAG: hypothetical protein KGI33_04820 [Thaumarchaeota archaeon]|nr:hypothetical protein [Nitrososphaerota archaeon]